MTNVFLLEYELRLKAWHELRSNIKDLPLSTQCVEIDKFWQRVPLQTYYLHTDYIKDWPTPWELISDNFYCYYARASGMIYTLFLLGTKNIELVEAKDDNSNEVELVLVDNAKYVLNYWPNSVLSNNLQDFKVVQKIDITDIKTKL